jgi:hypothetical protein
MPKVTRQLSDTQPISDATQEAHGSWRNFYVGRSTFDVILMSITRE